MLLGLGTKLRPPGPLGPACEHPQGIGPGPDKATPGSGILELDLDLG